MTKVSEKIETKVKANGNGKAADASAEVKVAENAAESKTAEKPSIFELQKQIQEQIDRFQRKSELIAQRERFINTRNELVDRLKEMGSDFDEGIDSPNLKIVLADKNDRYASDTAISISNNELVFEFVRMLLQKVIEKITKLEAEIVS